MLNTENREELALSLPKGSPRYLHRFMFGDPSATGYRGERMDWANQTELGLNFSSAISSEALDKLFNLPEPVRNGYNLITCRAS